MKKFLASVKTQLYQLDKIGLIYLHVYFAVLNSYTITYNNYNVKLFQIEYSLIYRVFY